MTSSPPAADLKRLRAAPRGSAVALSPAILEASGFAAGDAVRLVGQPGRILIAAATPAYADPLADRTRAAGRACLEQFRFALEVLGQERGLGAFARGGDG